MLPVSPTAVGPTISLDLDVDDVEMENYEVGWPFLACLCEASTSQKGSGDAKGCAGSWVSQFSLRVLRLLC